MSNEYFSTVVEALDVFTDEQRASDFQEFVLALSFFKKFDSTTFNGTEGSVRAIEDFQNFLKSITAFNVDIETHAQIRERAKTLQAYWE